MDTSLLPYRTHATTGGQVAQDGSESSSSHVPEDCRDHSWTCQGLIQSRQPEPPPGHPAGGIAIPDGITASDLEGERASKSYSLMRGLESPDVHGLLAALRPLRTSVSPRPVVEALKRGYFKERVNDIADGDSASMELRRESVDCLQSSRQAIGNGILA